MDKLGIKEFDFKENSFTRGDYSYSVASLIELSKNYEPFELKLVGINLDATPWGDQTIHSMAFHVRRMNDADMQYPIILDDTGYICDGWHRVLKAVVEGRDSIMAIRLTVMPDCL